MARSGLWSRGSLPSQITSTNGIEHTVDGVMNAPLSGESWDNVVFLKNVDRMAVIGVSRNGQYLELTPAPALLRVRISGTPPRLIRTRCRD